ncbi:substrate-binding domain-containing protein [Inquilinus sp. Marseille-Q2685]|uniref:substrate-binding domain-containing protein n=1 Tax=Inquilinus sp. Marseille-Q2685 TaxID=2866581 RepID=UPI001CE3D65D|nr:substrate-binding domain-containing protein [Inquilinus sp. Marseille-Q2685]
MPPFTRRAAALALLAGAVLLSGPGRAEPPRPEAIDRSALRVCADPANLPFSNDKGEGFENRIAELLAQKLGVPVRYTWYPNSTGFLRMTLRARRCDLVMGIVAGADLVQNSNPYYRSGYVLVTRREDKLDGLSSLSDPRLKSLRLGITAGTPPANLAARDGLMAQARPYPLVVDSRYDAPGKQMIDDLASRQIDVAVLWGPIAGYFAKQHGDALAVTPLSNEAKDTRLDFYITMGVRPGESDWKNRINKLIRENQDAITAILKDYGVPMLDARGQPML